MRVLITGSAGFIGSRLGNALRTRGEQVQSVDFRAAPGDGALRMDIRQVSASEVKPFDTCVHLASDVGGFLHNAAERGQVAYELELIHAVAELCRAKGCRRLIYASSIAVFEQADAFETGTLRSFNQRTGYAQAKAQGEKLCEELFDELVIVRPTNVFGAEAPCAGTSPGQSHVIPDLLRKIRAGQTLEVFGDGKQVRNFVHVDDVVRFLGTVLCHPHRGWFNLRSNIQLSIAALAQELLSITGQQREIVFQPNYLRYEPRPIEAFDLTESLALGWSPLVSSLWQGLQGVPPATSDIASVHVPAVGRTGPDLK